MDRYFIDDNNIIVYDGIRAVQKNSSDLYSNGGFGITIFYKGIHNIQLRYPNTENRDRAFNIICQQLALRNKK